MKEHDCDELTLPADEIGELLGDETTCRGGLSYIVMRVGNHFRVDVCSLYMLDWDGEHLTLSATVGLRQDSVGEVRMTVHEGLVGLVALQRGPVVVSHAQHHPRFKYFPEAGEDPYQAFLGVAVQDGDVLLGVLVIQTIEARAFTPLEVRRLTQVGEQLGPILHSTSEEPHDPAQSRGQHRRCELI